jgi:hypothetical protein
VARLLLVAWVAETRVRGTSKGSKGGTYPALVDAGLAHMSGDIAELILSVNGRWDGRGGGMGEGEAMVMVVG